MLRWSTRGVSRYLCVFIVVCDRLVEQRSGIIGSDTHRQVADEKEKGDVVIIVLGTEGLLY